LDLAGAPGARRCCVALRPVRVLTVNAGSSSLKLGLVADDRLRAEREVASPGSAIDRNGLAQALDALGPSDAVGHRIVHGGDRYRGAVLIDAAVIAALDELTQLAPLHQAKSLFALRAVSRMRPDLPAVACFDTAFHATIGAAAATYALPEAWRARWGLRRFGFHGLSHAYASRRAAQLVGRSVDGLRVITCHLGAGASLAAVESGRSVDTTMGFTPLDGLVMSTRSGSVDPGLLMWLLGHTDLTAAQVNDALEHESGMLGLAGSGDMRMVLAAADGGDAPAAVALEVYLHRLRGAIAAMAASMNGVDVIVWTGGVGEHAPVVRAAASARLGFLGVGIDPVLNASVVADGDISAEHAAVRSLVVVAHEDLEIARQVRDVLGGRGSAATPGGDV
jgi:acetate kinase